MVPIEYYYILSSILFTIGVLGVLIRRDAIIVLMSIELMLNAVNLLLIAVGDAMNSPTGEILVFFVIAVAAAEAAVGLGIIIAMFRNRKTTHLDEINILKW